MSGLLHNRYVSALLGLVLLGALAVAPPEEVTVYLIGDSTMSEKEITAYPETGWGMPFAHFFDTTVTVDNRAVNGRSTRTFIEEGRWQPVVDRLEEGDYVFIQFGHNDEVETKEQYTPPEAFEANLVRFVTDTRRKSATPVLLTPVARRRFDEAGHVVGTHERYSALVRKVAAAHDVPLIDMDRRSQALLQELGEEDARFLYNHLAPGQNPNYPEGVADDTHFNELGARRMAELVLAGLRALQLDLAERVIRADDVDR